jgi:hypothetical protein
MTNEQERRRYPRVIVDWPIVIITNRGATVGNAGNISARGALIRSEEPFRPKDRSILFLVPPDRLAFRVSFEVAWLALEGSAQRASDCSMGVRFIRMARGDGEFVVNFVQHHLRREGMRHQWQPAARLGGESAPPAEATAIRYHGLLAPLLLFRFGEVMNSYGSGQHESKNEVQGADFTRPFTAPRRQRQKAEHPPISAGRGLSARRREHSARRYQGKGHQQQSRWRLPPPP